MDIIMYPRHSIIRCVLVKGGPVKICTPTQRYYSKLAIYRRFTVPILLHPLSVWLTTAASEFTAQSMVTREIVSGVTAGDFDTQSTRSYALWSKIQYFLLDNEIKYVICKMTAILSRPQCVKHSPWCQAPRGTLWQSDPNPRLPRLPWQHPKRGEYKQCPSGLC